MPLAASASHPSATTTVSNCAASACNRTASPTIGSTSPRDSYVDNNTRISLLPFPWVLASTGIIRPDPGLEASPGFAIYWKWKEGATKIEFEADGLVAQAKTLAGVNSSTTSGFAVRGLNAQIPPSPCYHRVDGIWARADRE